MDLAFSAENEAFRRQLRSWFAEHIEHLTLPTPLTVGTPASNNQSNLCSAVA